VTKAGYRQSLFNNYARIVGIANRPGGRSERMANRVPQMADGAAGTSGGSFVNRRPLVAPAYTR